MSTAFSSRYLFRKPRFFLLVDPYGDHCNRLFQSIHFHAYCLEHHLPFFNLGILGMLRYVPGLLLFLRDTLLFPLKAIARTPFLGRCIHRFPPHRSLSPLVFVGGWDYRTHELTQKYRPQLSRLYRLRHKLAEDELHLLDQIQLARKAGSKVVGLHVRRGDYSSWQGGRYWLSDDSYASVVRSVRSQSLEQGHDCFVVVFTNDVDEPSCGQDLTARGRWFADLIAMQNCDLLVGPPSTFTLWASYSASVPYIHLQSFEKDISLYAASICFG
jgi:hypothetical protein